MKIKNIVMIVLTFLFVSGLFSCQTAVKLFLRIKDPKKYEFVSNVERSEYYKPFIDKDSTNYSIFSIYTMPDTTHLKTYMKKHVSYPMIIVQNTKTDSIYRLSCFDDMKWDINELNEGMPESLYKADRETYNDITLLLHENQLDLWYSKTADSLTKTDKKWNIYFVSGVFLGKKLRRLSLPVTNLKDVDQFNIIDLSVNKE